MACGDLGPKVIVGEDSARAVETVTVGVVVGITVVVRKRSVGARE